MSINDAREALLDAARAFAADERANRQALLEAAAKYQQARIAAASGAALVTAAAKAREADSKRSKCNRCGAHIVWGFYGNGKWAIIEPKSIPPIVDRIDGRIHFKHPMVRHECPR